MATMSLSYRMALNSVLLFSALALTSCGQDARDKKQPASSAAFQRLTENGTVYVRNGNFGTHPWSCVADRHTGLVWEVKTSAAGLRNKANTYTWYNPEKLNNGGDAGTRDLGKCSGSPCDTAAYTAAVNVQGLCGFHDWRVPTQQELATLNDARRSYPGPTVDTQFFPETQAAPYWTGTAYSAHYAGAWIWSFDYGYDRVDWKKQPHYLRLVRGALAVKMKNPDD